MKLLTSLLIIVACGVVPALYSQEVTPSAALPPSMVPDQREPVQTPSDFYAGHVPAVKIVSGDNQKGSPREFGPRPLVVTVLDEHGHPMPAAPVTFTVTKGTATVQALEHVAPLQSVTVRTDFTGQAKAYFRSPDSKDAPSEITCTPGIGKATKEVVFHVRSDDGRGEYDSPFNPTNVVATMNLDGSADVTWTNNADPGDTEPIDLMYRDAHGNWQVLKNVPAGTTSYHVPAP